MSVAAGYAAVLVAGLLLGPRITSYDGSPRKKSLLGFELGDRSDKVEEVLQIINENYVDSVTIDTVQNMAIQEILKHLDPHSAYLAPSEAQSLTEDLEGNFDGIGIEYYILNDTLLVTSVSPGGPASKAGLKHGDKILSINKHQVSGIKITPKKIVEQIRGKKGTPVEILVKRDTTKRNFSVLRQRIVVSSIDAAYMLNEQNGYIKISKFGAHTDEDFAAQLQRLQKLGMKNLVLDLRDNGGGYLSAATGLADEFLKNNELIVYTEGLHEPRTDYFASSKGNFEQGKLVVLIDENTASASEIVAGAIQDLERGTIIGRRSFGKGLVQEQFDFGDGSALNLTIARYYTASGRSIQKSYKKGNEAYYGEVGNRYKNGELVSDGKNLSDTLFDKKKTFTTKSGKVLYGGGGIMPDIYVPVDTSGFTNVYYALGTKGILNDLVFNHLVKANPKYNSSEEIVKSFRLGDQEIKKIVQLAAAKKIKITEKQVEISRKEIETQIKALFARYYFGDEGYYKALNSGDQAIARSLEVLK
ncbi:S41 family peptidase [Daejeonella lutea]|uniref:S41 family peptidase n=1 Tax=Daejeonella lutea TaxID=572036 RepID=UPI001FE5D201|nr:S41 family peptidase [Daejeonella lutea]